MGGWGFVFRTARFRKVVEYAVSRSDGRGTRIHGRPPGTTMRRDRRLGSAPAWRPSRSRVGRTQGRAFPGHDHPQGIWRPGFFGARQQYGRDENGDPVVAAVDYGHGAELAGACRIAYSLRYAGPARLLPPASGAGRGDSCFCAHRTGSRLRCGFDRLGRRGIPGGRRIDPVTPELEQAVHYAGGHSDHSGVGISLERPGKPAWQGDRPRYYMRAYSDGYSRRGDRLAT